MSTPCCRGRQWEPSTIETLAHSGTSCCHTLRSSQSVSCNEGTCESDCDEQPLQTLCQPWGCWLGLVVFLRKSWVLTSLRLNVGSQTTITRLKCSNGFRGRSELKIRGGQGNRAHRAKNMRSPHWQAGIDELGQTRGTKIMATVEQNRIRNSKTDWAFHGLWWCVLKREEFASSNSVGKNSRNLIFALFSSTLRLIKQIRMIWQAKVICKEISIFELVRSRIL